MPEWKMEVKQSRFLLVEGRDEVTLFLRMTNEMGVDNLQIFDSGGKEQFRARLDVILADARAREIQLTHIGAVRDADNDGNAAFTSVRDSLKYFGLVTPSRPRVIAEDSPSTAILILPDDSGPGAIENLCLNSIMDHPAYNCVENYVACLKEHNCNESNNPSKTAVHAFLASRTDPTTTVGMGAEKGYWNLDSPAFDIIRDFIHLISDSRDS